MSSLQSVELYDPESPSIDDDLCLDCDQSSVCKVTEAAVSCVQNGRSLLDSYAENENSESADYSQKLSVAEDNKHLEVTQCSTTVHDKQECVLNVTQTEELIKPLFASKPAVIWKTAKKILRSTLKEFDDVQTVNDDTVKPSLNIHSPDTTVHLPELDDQKLQSSQQLQQQCSNSSLVTNDSIISAPCDVRGIANTSGESDISEPVTTEKICARSRNQEHNNLLQVICASEPSSIMCNSHTKSIDEIAEPTEPCDVDVQTIVLSQEPRTIELSRIVEDPSEPDELLHVSDSNCSSEHIKCPRVIRLDRARDSVSHSTAPVCDNYISDPSEPANIEPVDVENPSVIPRQIRLNRADNSENLFDVFTFTNKHNSSSLIKPRIVQLNTLLETNSTVNSSDDKAADKIAYCLDTPLSPTESVRSVSEETDDIVCCDETPLSPTESLKSVIDSDIVERQATKTSMPEVDVFGIYNFSGVTVGENKCSLSYDSTMKSSHSVSALQYLSDGEIVDDEEEEPLGIFQIPASAPFSESNKDTCEQRQKKGGKKRLYESIVDNDGHSIPEDVPDTVKINKRQKVWGNACSSVSVTDEYSDKRIIVSKTKTVSKLPSSEKRKHKKRKSEHTLGSAEKLLVGDSNATKRKVVVINKSVDKPQKNKHFECRVSPSVVITREIQPSFTQGDAVEIAKRTSNKRKHAAKWHRKRHMHQNKSRTQKQKRKHKKHRHRKRRSDAEDSVLIQRHSRSRTRSYDRIIEMIRSEEQQQSPHMHRLRSVVVHRDTLVSARQRSLSDSSHDTHHSVENVTMNGISQNSDSRSRNESGGPMHLSRLSYSGLLEQDGHTTLLGECIKSKCGPDIDFNFVSRNLANVLSGTDDDVEILGVSYPGDMQSKNTNLQNAYISSQQRDDGREVVALSLLGNHSDVHVERLASNVGEKSVNVKHPATNDVADKENKKVTVLSKEVQTQESLFSQPQDHTTEYTIFSKRKQTSDHGKVDKELQVSDFDNDEEHMCSLSYIPAVGCNTVLSEVANGIQSPENYLEEDSYVPRPVLLERTDAKATPESPKQDFNDIGLCVTVPNVSESLFSVTKTIALERVAESNGEPLPRVTVSDTGVTFSNTTERYQLEAIAASSTEIGSTSSAASVLGQSGVNATEQLSSKNSDLYAVEQLSDVDSNEHRKEQYQLPNHNIPVTAPAVHHLPPLVKHNPFQYQRALPRRRVNPPLTENQSVHHTNTDDLSQQQSVSEQPNITVNGHSSAFHLPDTSAIQQLPSEPAVNMRHSTHSQQPLSARTLSVDASIDQSVSAVPSLPVLPQVQHETQSSRCSSALLDSLSFFNLKSDRIPGICEDVELDTGRYQSQSRIGVSSSSHQSSLVPSSLLQTSGYSDVTDLVTANAIMESEMLQPTIIPSYGVASYVNSPSYMTTDLLPLSSSQAGSASIRYSVPQTANTLMPAAAVNSGNSLMKQTIAPILPLLGTIATQLFKVPLQPQITTVPVSSTVASGIPTVSSSSSVVTVPALKHVTTTITSTEAISAWITSLPKSTTVEKPQLDSPPPPPPPRPPEELDFDVDAVVSPRSDEIMSFSPPSSEHMMAVVKMKHTLGLKKKSSKKTTNGLKNPTKAEKVSNVILIKIKYSYIVHAICARCRGIIGTI